MASSRITPLHRAAPAVGPETHLRESLGDSVGALWAGPVAAVSALRHARMFHPRGVAVHATVEAHPGPYAELARALEGPALARLSGALFKRDVPYFEVLGIALRFASERVRDASPRDGDQDLLFATIVSPLTIPLAPFTTRSDDFLANHYWAVAPFAVAGIGRVKFRLAPLPSLTRAPRSALGRNETLLRDIAAGGVAFRIELRSTFRWPWRAIATLRLESESAVDQEALRFDPFRAGRGIVPVGFVHTIRRRTYAASQAARPASSGANAR